MPLTRLSMLASGVLALLAIGVPSAIASMCALITERLKDHVSTSAMRLLLGLWGWQLLMLLVFMRAVHSASKITSRPTTP